MQQRRLLATITLATLGALAGCGGGGGGGASSAPSDTAQVVLSGDAAKGLIAQADVSVYAVNSDGSVASTALDTKSTDAHGHYSLSFTATPGQPYVVKVSANANTTHADEATGVANAPLPVGFAMRSVLVPQGTGAQSISASVTPFSEIAVAAAARASGGLSATNVNQAISTVNQLLGFNPIQVTPKPVASAGSADEQKLAVLLAAVSTLAKKGDLGCSGGSAGDKTQCVVSALAGSASTTSIKLSTGSVDVSAALGNAVSTVLSDTSLSGAVDPSLLAVVTTNLSCSGSSCTAATGSGGGPDATATAISAAKLLFSQITTDWKGLFSRGGATPTGGAANAEAYAFQTAFSGAQLPVEALGKDLGALLTGIDLYNDYRAGRTSVPSRGASDGAGVSNDGNADYSAMPAVGCTLYQDANTSIVATAPANANFIGCGARFYFSHVPGSNVISDWRHGFTVTPNGDGSFGWQTRARRRDYQCSGNPCYATTSSPVLANVALQVDPITGVALAAFVGTVTPTLNAPQGDITSFALNGEWAAPFVSGGTTLSGFKQGVSLSGTQTQNTDGTGTSTVAGSLNLEDDGSAVLSTVTVKTGTMGQIPVKFDDQGNIVPSGTSAAPAGHAVSSLSLDLILGTPTAEFEGVISATNPVLDKSGSESVPTLWSLSGDLRKLSGGTATEFLSGVFTVKVSGESTYDATQLSSTSNQRTATATFVGTLTTPDRPTIEITLGVPYVDDGSNSSSAWTLQYRTLVSTAPKLVVSITTDAAGNSTLSEASAGLTMKWGDGATTVSLLSGSTVIGSLDLNSSILTFSDGSFISLSTGL